MSLCSFGDYLSLNMEHGVVTATPYLTATGAAALSAGAVVCKASSSRVIVGAAAVAVTATACFVNVLRLARDAVVNHQAMQRIQDMQRMQAWQTEKLTRSRCSESPFAMPMSYINEEDGEEAGGYSSASSASHFLPSKQPCGLHGDHDTSHLHAHGGPQRGDRQVEPEIPSLASSPNKLFKDRINGQLVGTVATLLVVGAAALAFTRLALLGFDAAAAGGRQIPVPVVLHKAVADVVKPLMTPKA